MQLPPELTRGIDELIQGIPRAEPVRASTELSSEYRRRRKSSPQLDHLHQTAYLISRSPATLRCDFARVAGSEAENPCAAHRDHARFWNRLGNSNVGGW